MSPNVTLSSMVKTLDHRVARRRTPAVGEVTICWLLQGRPSQLHSMLEVLPPYIQKRHRAQRLLLYIFVFVVMQSVMTANAPVCQTQEARQLRAPVLADVHVVEELSLQLTDLLLGIRASSFPLGTWFPCSRGGKWQRHDSKWSLMAQTDSGCPNYAIIASVSVCQLFLIQPWCRFINTIRLKHIHQSWPLLGIMLFVGGLGLH